MGRWPRQRDDADLLAPLPLLPTSARPGERGVWMVYRFRTGRWDVVSREMGAVRAKIEPGCRHSDRHDLPCRSRPSDPPARTTQSLGPGVDKHTPRRALSAFTVLVPNRTGQYRELPSRLPRSSPRVKRSAPFCFGDGPFDRAGATVRFGTVATANSSGSGTGLGPERTPSSGRRAPRLAAHRCKPRSDLGSLPASQVGGGQNAAHEGSTGPL